MADSETKGKWWRDIPTQ